ncbi:MAG: undecaprenyl-phosphate glucose phosphotransferase [Bdellovibrionales bacterium]|nr:undecaprenyl-phosphate glucose phosphotransferase [Bdellovibrionales bacterium]
MLKRYQHIVGGVFRVVDAAVVGAAWLAAYWLRFDLEVVSVTKGIPPFETYAALLPLVMILWSTVLASMGAYRPRRMLRRTHEIQLLIRAHSLALLLFIALTYVFSEYRYSRAVMAAFAGLSVAGLLGFRIALRNALRIARARGWNLRHVLLVGEGPTMDWLAARLKKYPELGFRAMGAVVAADSPTKSVGGVPVLGVFEDIGRLIGEKRPDQVVISLPRAQYPQLDALLTRISDEGVEVKLIPDVHEFVTVGCEVEEFEGLPIVNLNGSPMEGWGMVLKRATDFSLSLGALVLLSPLLLLLAIAVKLGSRGPVIFRQKRMGLDGRTFEMLKFRTMRADAETGGSAWTVENDPRRTALGTFLRTTSLDELPQLWNVFRGQMSLVGPRPEQPYFVQQFKTRIPHYMLRHKVKAGLTGWAQVNGWRGDTSLDRRIECDLYYIRNWSYSLDWKIIFLTVWKGFVNRNAY